MPKPGFLGHRKFLKLVALMRPHIATGKGVNVAAAVLGHYEFLTNAQHAAGQPLIGDADDVEAVSQWGGERGAWTAALLKCGSGAGDGLGLIEEVTPGSGIYQLHDYWDHAPDFVKKRRSRHEMAAALAVAEAAKAEKKNGAAAAAADAEEESEPGAAADEPPPVVLLRFPCFPGKKGMPDEWPLTEAVFAELSELFPSVPREVLLQHCRQALGWIRTHKRKTYSGMKRFLNDWLCNNVPKGLQGALPSGSQGGGAPFHREIR